MATTFTPRGKIYMAPNMCLDFGDYNTDGSTVATLSVSGGYVQSVEFYDANQNPLGAGTTPAYVLSAKTLTGAVTSYTVTPSSGAVTNGTYQVFHGGS